MKTQWTRSKECNDEKAARQSALTLRTQRTKRKVSLPSISIQKKPSVKPSG